MATRRPRAPAARKTRAAAPPKPSRPTAGDAAIVALRKDVAAVGRAVAAQAEAMAATFEAWNESLLRLPRAEDYEPLAGPLREFARVSPALVEALRAVVKTAGLRAALADAADRMASAQAAIRGGLGSLPRDPAYVKVAAQLRELATVSPSLMEWLRQIPTLTLPLGEAIAALGEAAQELEEAERAARRALESP
jgi:hypothetical protein